MVLISIKHIVSVLAALAVGAQCGVIGHDDVSPLKQAVRGGRLGKLLLKHQPFLKVRHGCVPFPAVDSDGNTSGGLEASGWHSGMCSSSKGQVYGRTVVYDGRRALMYAWYFPKDNPSPAIGHRHDWEAIVVWLDKDTDEYLGLAVGGHGGFAKTTVKRSFSNGHPLIKYDNPISKDGVNHRLGFTREKGGMQPLIDWAKMDGKVQRALKKTDWGSANFPIAGPRFEQQLKKARLDD